MTRTNQPDFEDGTLNAYAVHGNEIQPGDRYGYKVVAVIHESWHSWAAYRGPTAWGDGHVAENGDLVREEVARALFPTLSASCRIYST